jgi:hypothetical protein
MTEPPLEGTPPAIGPTFEAGAPHFFEAVEPVSDLAYGPIVPAEATTPAALRPSFGAEAGTFTMPGEGEATLSSLPLKDAVSNYSVEENRASSKSSGLSGSLPRLLDGSLFGELRAALLPPGAVANLVATGAQDRTPLLPFGFPDGAPAGSSSSLGSSGFGIGLDLLAALALLSLLLRRAGSAQFPRDHFRPVSSFRPVTELPG